MMIHSIKSKIILALCLLVSLLLLQSYFFNYSQTVLLNLQKAQHTALIQTENVTRLENYVISLQGQAIAFVDNANKNTIKKFNFYLNAAELNLKQLKENTLQRNLDYKNTLTRLSEYLDNYQETFDQITINRTKREQHYNAQFKSPINDLKVSITALKAAATTEKKVIYTDILLTISNLEHATVSYLYKPRYDESQNVKKNLDHLNLKLMDLSEKQASFFNNANDLKQAYNQLVLLTRSYTFSINVVLTGIENELLYLTNQVKDIEKNKKDIAN
jgi:hypothetical protein